jgi:hypothetical protein
MPKRFEKKADKRKGIIEKIDKNGEKTKKRFG